MINPPQCCILAVGGAEKDTVVSASGSLESIQRMKVTLSYDRRGVDEEMAALWLESFTRYIEQPQLLTES